MAGMPLVKLAAAGADAQQALNDANTFYATNPGQSEYVFVYGGTGAGYLFYISDSAFHFATSGMAILGANGQNSVNASDITTISSNINA
jgi:hypothetical protein